MVAELNGLGIETVMLTGDNRPDRRGRWPASWGSPTSAPGSCPPTRPTAIAELNDRTGPDRHGRRRRQRRPRPGRRPGQLRPGRDLQRLGPGDRRRRPDGRRPRPPCPGWSASAAPPSRRIRQNIALALGTKALVLVLAVFGLATLWMAILADVGVSLLVTVIARLLRRS